MFFLIIECGDLVCLRMRHTVVYPQNDPGFSRERWERHISRETHLLERDFGYSDGWTRKLSRPILDGYFTPLVFWYQWEYHGISTNQQRIYFFCRVSKIGKVIPNAKRPEEYAPSIWGLGRLGSYNEQICFKDFHPVHAHPKVKIIGVSSLFASHQIRVYLCLKSTAFVGSSYPNCW